LWILLIFFSAIILYEGFKEGNYYLSGLIVKEKETHSLEVCKEIKEVEKIIEEIRNDFQKLKTSTNELQEEDKKAKFLALLELEKKSNNIQVCFLDYRNDFSLKLYNKKDKTDLFYEEIKNLNIYIDSFEKLANNVLIKNYPTKEDFYFLELSSSEFEEKLKSIRKNAGSCY